MYLPTKDTAQLTDCLLFRPGVTNLLGIHLKITTELPHHYKQVSLTIEAELRDATIHPERFPVYHFVVDEEAEVNIPFLAALTQEHDNQETFFGSSEVGLRALLRNKPNLKAPLILKFMAGDWVVALHDQVHLRTRRLIMGGIPLGSITALEIVK